MEASNTDDNRKKRPMTSAERVRAYRKRRAENDPDYTKRENKRIKDLRKAQVDKMTEEEREVHRRQISERVRLCRLRKKVVKQGEAEKKLVVKINKGFKTPQSLGKAVRRLAKNLPQSPSKKLAAVAGLANHVGLELNDKMTANLNGSTKRGLSEDDVNLITDFYYRTDIV